MSGYIEFVETNIFSKIRREFIEHDDVYRNFQASLASNPEQGPVIQGTGGLRKVRLALPGKGKSGGLRVIYLYLKIGGFIYLVYAYAKGELESLTAEQKNVLKNIVEEIKEEHRQ